MQRFMSAAAVAAILLALASCTAARPLAAQQDPMALVAAVRDAVTAAPPAGLAPPPADAADALPPPAGGGACVEYQLPPGAADMAAVFSTFTPLSQDDLAALWAAADAPAPASGMPLRGCTYGFVPGDYTLASLGRELAQASNGLIGWSGKCFGAEVDAATGTPTTLVNAFSPKYMDAAAPAAERVAGTTQAEAAVYWAASSWADGRPAWVFDYSKSAPLSGNLGVALDVHGVRDEVRLLPGSGGAALIGKMFLGSSDTGGYFLLFGACGAGGGVAALPGQRALPPLAAGAAAN
ncbi:MAG: hypothetical protein J3K34DRAFT_524503 [Monoraphidium minutum]|nr:MAG: hypothetical protein J3K34DRAFT_524503 [Monoraphidium minutum]